MQRHYGVTLALSVPASTFCAAFLHCSSVTNSLFSSAGVLISLLVFLNISMDSLACVKGGFHIHDGFPKLHLFPSCFPRDPTYQLLNKLKPAFLKSRICSLVLVFLSPPEDLQLHYFSVTTTKPATECHIPSHFFLISV